MPHEPTSGNALVFELETYLTLAIGLAIVVMVHCVKISLKQKPRITWVSPSIGSIATAIYLAFILSVIATQSYNRGYADASEHICRELIK